MTESNTQWIQGGTNDELKKSAESVSLDEYTEIAKRINWHIDETEFPKLQKLREFNFDNEFNQYIDALLSTKCPWEEADMQFVNSVWKKNEFINRYEYIFSVSALSLILSGFFIGLFLNDVVGALLAIDNIGMAIGDLIAVGIVIGLLSIIPVGALLTLFSPNAVSSRINDRDNQIATILIFFVVWGIYSLLRQWYWKDVVHQPAVLTYNYQVLFAICVIVTFLILQKNTLVKKKTADEIIKLIDQNRNLMTKAIVQAGEYKF